MALNFSGGATGDAVAPFIVGILLGGVSFWGLNWGGFGWRTVAFLNVVPAALTGSSLLAFLRSGAAAAPRPADFRQYVSSVLPLLKNAPVMGVVGLFALRGMVHQSFRVYLVLYLKEQLEYTDFVTGLHISLLTLLGVIASPIMGRISDRSGRHKVIFAAMLVTAALIFCFAFAKSGIPLAILLALIGAVIFPVGSVMSAAALDAAPAGVEGSTVAVMFSGGLVIGAVAPVLAGLINQSWGFEGVTVFAGTIAVCGAVVAVLVPTGRRVNTAGSGSAPRA
jgi:predicted MFS family arabinose efflux permease